MTANTYSETAYVAWGIDYETHPEGSRYWVAIWDDDGPQSEEFGPYYDRNEAEQGAKMLAVSNDLEAVEVDEFGAVVSA